MPVSSMPQTFLLGHKLSTRTTKRHTVCQSQAAPPSSGRGKSSKGSVTSSKRKFAEPNVTGKVKQQTRSPSKKQTGQQEVADLAALRQQKATSAAKQARGISGLQRAVALRGLDALPQPFAEAAKAIMVTACTILNSFVATQLTHAKYVQSLVLQCCVSEAASVHALRTLHCSATLNMFHGFTAFAEQGRCIAHVTGSQQECRQLTAGQQQ